MNFNQLVRNATLRPIWSDEDDSFWFTENGVVHRIDPRLNTSVIDPDAPPQAPAFDRNKTSSPDGKLFLERRDFNLFLGAAGGDAPGPLTNDGTPDCFWAAAPSAWSPDGSTIVLRRFDSRNVPRIPLVDFTKALETVEWFRYPKAGEGRRSMELHATSPRFGLAFAYVPCATGFLQPGRFRRCPS